VPLSAVPGEPPYVLRSNGWVGGEWQRVEYPADAKLRREDVNAAMARDLLDAIERNREPICGARDGRWTIEMVAGIYQSHYAGTRAAFPLHKRT
jgi:hypothetical protein